MDDTKIELPDLRSLMRGVIEEFVQSERSKAEPAYKAELMDERKRREDLERRVNELVQENRVSQQLAEEAERSASVRAELQRLGVGKVDLAYRAVKDDITRGEDGRLMAKTGLGVLPAREYLAQFVQENPELLPARISGGSGMGGEPKYAPLIGGLDLEKIRPGMSSDELEKVRQEVSRVASQTLRGQ
jgi:hypothetical protein